MTRNFDWDAHLGDPEGDPQDAYSGGSGWSWKSQYAPRWCASPGCQLIAVEGWRCHADKRIYCKECAGEYVRKTEEVR